ncbi:MAG: type II toxin-antitoxin system death-on-curing family toxin [bacterium]
MMNYLTMFQILELHRQIIATSGGSSGTKDFGALDSAIAQPEMTFGGVDLYPTLTEKAAALAYSLCLNHPFVDGNKRIAHAAMEVFLVLNGFEINASVDEQEKLFLDLASGNVNREELIKWLDKNILPAQKIK